MLIEFASSGEVASSAVMAFPRVVVVVLVLVVGALVLFYGKTLYSNSNWKAVVSSTPAVAWLFAKFENGPVNTSNNVAVQKLAKDHRQHMDSVAARRLSRDIFLATHSEYNFKMPPVKCIAQT